MTAIKLGWDSHSRGIYFMYVGFFGAAAELGFGRCYIGFRDLSTLNNIDRNQRSSERP